MRPSRFVRPSAHSWFALATMLMLLGAAYAAALGTRPSTVVLMLALASAPYLGLCFLEPGIPPSRSTRRALWLAVIAGGAMVFAPPALSDDVFRFVWEGKLWANGLSPYHYAPDDPALTDFRDSAWAHINSRELTTIYPPLAQLVFWLVYRLTGSIIGFKLLALGAHLLCVVAVARLAGSHGPRASFAMALNPLALAESAMNGHLDVFTGLLLLAVGWALARSRPVSAAAALLGAVGFKLVGFAALPLFTRTRLAVLLATACLAFAMLVPLVGVSPHSDRDAGLEQYALRWRGNASVYALLEVGVGELVEGVREPTEPTVLDPSALRPLLTRSLVVLIVLGLGFWLAYRRTNPVVALRSIVLVGLLLAPQVHPWYLLWLLPLELSLGRVVAVAWSISILVTYLPLDLWIAEQIWIESVPALVFEYVVVGLALASEAFLPRKPQ